MSGTGNGALESIKNVGHRTKAIEDFPRHQYGHLANVANTNAAMQAVNQLNSVLGNPVSDKAIFNGMLRLGFF